eukprot:195174-Rhodomonas_salina.1
MFCFLFLAEPILGLPPFSRAPASFPHGYATHSRAEKTTSELLSEADTCAADADFVSPREDVDAIKGIALHPARVASASLPFSVYIFAAAGQ